MLNVGVSLLYGLVLMAVAGAVVLAGVYAHKSAFTRTVMDYSSFIIVVVPVVVLIWYFKGG